MLSAMLLFIVLMFSELSEAVTQRQRDTYYVVVYACLVAQTCQTLCDPLYCSPPDSSVHVTFRARIPEGVVIFLLQGILLNQGWNLHLLHLLHCRQVLYPLGHPGSYYLVKHQLCCSSQCKMPGPSTTCPTIHTLKWQDIDNSQIRRCLKKHRREPFGTEVCSSNGPSGRTILITV